MVKVFGIILAVASLSLVQGDPPKHYMFCHATEPVVNTNVVFISNIYQTNMNETSAADDYHTHALDDGYDVHFECLADQSFAGLLTKVVPIITDIQDNGFRVAQVLHPWEENSYELERTRYAR